MVKVGDKIRILVDGADHANVKRGDEFVICEVFGCGGVRVDGECRWIFYPCSYEVIHATPPHKITQNGYEYSLVGPVKPEWLVDGTWVVDKETGRKYRVSCDNGVYTFNNGTREVIIDFISLPTRFRPHEPKDWKWGDWAMYEGKRVFVMKGIDRDGDVAISGVGIGCTDTNYCFTKPDKLTPTF